MWDLLDLLQARLEYRFEADMELGRTVTAGPDDLALGGP